MTTAKLQLLCAVALSAAVRVAYAQQGFPGNSVIVEAESVTAQTRLWAATANVSGWGITAKNPVLPHGRTGFLFLSGHVQPALWLLPSRIEPLPSSAGSHTPAPSVVQTTITNDIWLGGVGNWNNAALWSTGIPTASSAVLIDNGNPVASTVTLNVNGSANSLTINSGDALTMNNATVLTISGSGNSLANAGTISMNSDGNTTKLVIDGNVTLGGGGTLTMSANVNNVIIGAATTDTLTNQETIQGSGSVGGGEMTLVNSGTIDADHSTAALTIAANGGTTNAGTLEATAGGTLGFSGTTVTNTGGTINTSAGGIAASNSVIDGGAVMLAGGK